MNAILNKVLSARLYDDYQYEYDYSFSLDQSQILCNRKIAYK